MTRQRLTRWATGAAAVALALAVPVSLAPCVQARTAPPQAGNEATAEQCPTGAVCGTLTVPLLRGTTDPRTTHVAYALVPRKDTSRPAAGTIAVNPGGPGGAVIPLAQEYSTRLEALRRDHDLLLMDPRGTGSSDWQSCGTPPDVFTYPKPRLQRAMERCAQRLGDRRNAYTSANIADDLDAVRAELGIKRLVLFGQSYGTYLMSVYADHHPTRVDKIVLSGAYPLTTDPWMRPNARSVATALTAFCRSSGTCAPDKAVSDTAALAARLRHHPIRYTLTAAGRPRTQVIDEGELVKLHTLHAGGSPDIWPRLTTAVRQALRGRPDALVRLAKEFYAPVSDLRTVGTHHSAAMAFSVICHDYAVPYRRSASLPVRQDQLLQGRRRIGDRPFAPFSAAGWTEGSMDTVDACIRWPGRTDTTYRPTGHMPDVPALVLAGDLDTNTGAAYGRQAAAQFRHSTFVLVPGAGHTPDHGPCATSLLNDFVRTGHLTRTCTTP